MRRFLALSVLTLVSVSICANASIWESGKIVYTSQIFSTSDLDIYSMGPNGDDRTILTDSIADDYDPTWSPNGRQILFVSERDGQPDIYIMDNDGGNQRPIRVVHKHRTSPTWAPDGQRIAYSLDSEQIFIYDLIRAVPEYIVAGANPAWSPDGRYIAFIRDGSLYVIDLETMIESKLVDSALFGELSDPTWGSQSNYIVFSWVGLLTDSGIYYVPRWGGVAEILHQVQGHHVHHPDIAPYGGEILVEVHPDSFTEQHIYKVTHRTNNWQQLTLDSNSTYNYDPDWWHPTSFSVQPNDSQSTTTWGQLKKK